MLKFSVVSQVQKSDCIIFPFFEGERLESELKNLDKEFEGAMTRVIESKDFEAKRMQMNVLYVNTPGVSRILLLGLGKEEEVSMRIWKHAVGSAMTQLQTKKMTHVSLSIPQLLKTKFGAYEVAREALASLYVAEYSFDMYKQEDARVTQFKQFDIFEPKEKFHADLKHGLKEGQVIGEAVNMTRHLGNTPPHVMTPSFLAEEAKKLHKQSKGKISVKVLSKSEIEKLKMGCFLGVAQGSSQEPKFIIVEYFGGKKSEKPTVLVGKGITFDSGGISLKPGDYLMDMKFDMLGGATVLGIIQSLAGLQVKKNVVGLIPACENMPSGDAYRPDDILVAMNGISVEIVNTDAEGRLILADALCYAARYEPKEVIDFATLTGHCMIALGNERSGIFTKKDELAKKLDQASEQVGEYVWRLPLGEEFTEGVKSDVADLKNGGGVGHPRYGGASIGAAFLEHFVSYPWLHMDMSCSHYGSNKPYVRKGANGFGVQMMVEYLRNN